MIFSLGGHYLNVSILHLDYLDKNECYINILNSESVRNVGGESFKDLLLDKCVDLF
jgi:hypothetical protein